MKIGVVFPQTEIGNDPIVIRDYTQTAEGLGFSHILAYDHVLGANPQRPGGWSGPYTYETPFHEVFALFGFMAALTSRVELATGIVILPQRQTALVAKQAASVDVLSGGRLRLGVGLGWNEVEYVSLNEDFHNRGKRIEEQIEVMRRLWTEPLVTFDGKWHHIPDAGINPLPVRRPIPIWFGAAVDAALKRAARLADGWICLHGNAREARPAFEKLDGYLMEAGRSRKDFGVEARVSFQPQNPQAWEKGVKEWSEAGISHLSVNTMGSGLATPRAHIEAITQFAKVVLE